MKPLQSSNRVGNSHHIAKSSSFSKMESKEGITRLISELDKIFKKEDEKAVTNPEMSNLDQLISHL